MLRGPAGIEKAQPTAVKIDDKRSPVLLGGPSQETAVTLRCFRWISTDQCNLKQTGQAVVLREVALLPDVLGRMMAQHLSTRLGKVAEGGTNNRECGFGL